MRITLNQPALILAPMDGLTDAPMRAIQGEIGAFTFAVSEFLRVNQDVPPKKVFYRHVPELRTGTTVSGLPVQVQLLGGDADRMAEAAVVAYEAGAKAIDINFGCPAPTVNRHDGGATLLKYPHRIRDIVASIRAALPMEIPVSAKLRLGWDSIDSIFENADMAVEGGASWLTIHGRTRLEGYKPPAHWAPIGIVRERVGVPVVANGDIWTLDEFRRCLEVTGCDHFMLGRGALANPLLSHQVARELGIAFGDAAHTTSSAFDWLPALRRLVELTELLQDREPRQALCRLKQWLSIASRHGDFAGFDAVKRAESVEELFATLTTMAGRAPDIVSSQVNHTGYYISASLCNNPLPSNDHSGRMERTDKAGIEICRA
jgi:tRNA-dihydrouridine synthase C